jgi:hypothetical protein
VEAHVLLAGEVSIEARALEDDPDPLADGGPSVTTSRPSIRAWPPLGMSVVVRIERVVVLPAPFGPRRAKNSPDSTSKLIPSTALRSALR